MTDDEIMKGFDCHRRIDCVNCPFNGHGCSKEMYDQVEKMVARLKVQNKNYQEAFHESLNDALSEYSNVLVGKLLLAKEHTVTNPDKEESLEYIRGKADAFDKAVKAIDKTLEEMVG